MPAMSKTVHVSETPATRWLREHHVEFSEHPYDYEEHGGTEVSARELGVDEHAVVILQCARALSEYGVEPRHLRAFRSAADRQSDLIAQIAGPVVKAGARDRADDLAREVAALAITLHTSLIKSAVRDVLDR